MSLARSGLGGAGTQTAALGFAGYKGGSPVNSGATESWNGSIWTNLPSMTTVRHNLGSAGTQAAALGFGGNAGSPGTTATEEWTGEVATAGSKTLTTS